MTSHIRGVFGESQLCPVCGKWYKGLYVHSVGRGCGGSMSFATFMYLLSL